MKDYIPYAYLIGWSKLNKWYYGIEYGNGKNKIANPDNLWKCYFTSSKIVKEFVKTNGDPDIIQIRKKFNNAKQAVLWEFKVCRRLNVKDSPKWLNQHNGNGDFRLKFVTAETRKKLSDIKKGIKFSKESIEKRLNTRKLLNKPNPMLGRKHKDETKKKMSIKRKGKPSKNKGIKLNYTPESKEKLRLSRIGGKSKSKNWSFVFDGKEIIIFNLKKYCRDNNLSISCMTKVGKGLKNEYKGYSFAASATSPAATLSQNFLT